MQRFIIFIIKLFLILWPVTSLSLWVFGDIEISEINIGAIILALYVPFLYFFAFDTLKTGEVGARDQFGELVTDLKYGLHFFLPFIEKMDREDGEIHPDELPANPELVHLEDDTPAPPGKFLPIRILFGPPNPLDVDLRGNPYNTSMVVRVTPVINWRISSLKVFREKMRTIENCRDLLTDKAVATFADDFAKVTPAKAMKTLTATDAKLLSTLKTDTADWGIEIVKAYVKPFDFSHKLNSAVVGVVVSGQNALGVKETANGERYRLEQEGIGQAEAVKIMFGAQAIGYKKIAKALGITEGALILQMETAQKALENANYSIVPGDGVYGLFTGLKEAMEKIKT